MIPTQKCANMAQWHTLTRCWLRRYAVSQMPNLWLKCARTAQCVTRHILSQCLIISSDLAGSNHRGILKRAAVSVLPSQILYVLEHLGVRSVRARLEHLVSRPDEVNGRRGVPEATSHQSLPTVAQAGAEEKAKLGPAQVNEVTRAPTTVTHPTSCRLSGAWSAYPARPQPLARPSHCRATGPRQPCRGPCACP